MHLSGEGTSTSRGGVGEVEQRRGHQIVTIETKSGSKRRSLTSNAYPGALSDFYGLPTNPVCGYRTIDVWPVPKGPEAQCVPQEARPVCKHPVKWSTIDPVRFAEEGKEAGPLHLWVGVIPGPLSFEAAKVAADGCKEIAFRSVFSRSMGPQLLDLDPSIDPIADICSPFTPSLGIQIAPRNTPHFEGTGALYLCESERVFLLTTRHVALPPPTHRNQLYSHKYPGQRRQDILILGSKAYPDALEEMMGRIGRELIFVDTYKTELAKLGEAVEGENARVTAARNKFQDKLANAEQMIAEVYKFHGEITRHWSTPSQRVLGYVVHAPPLSVATGPKQFMEDWALIDLNRDKIDWNTFKGNVVYLGNKISRPDFVRKMHPHLEGRSNFEYPIGGRLQVKSVLKEADIRNPKQLDANGEECLLVVKNGKTTKVTIGRGTGTGSFIREYDQCGIKRTSTGVAIYPYSHTDGAFPAPGDSGSIVVDGQGRTVGLLTGGSGTTNSTDVTYVMPYFWVEERVNNVFPNSYLYPIVDY
ncbi:hypothetical protein F5I97DRAFT_1936641 [Phlebopus sp. FC_14]|nr:hypothetical protein F5I97DRAFT_1936641 [Phlebopus sp. FC_14]